MDARPDVIRRIESISAERNHARSAAALVGVVIAIALFVGARERAPMIAPPARATQGPFGETPGPDLVVVHVVGAVRRPGVYELPHGARVSDALELAGGALPHADLAALNLAEVLLDGRQILVARRGEVDTGVLPEPTTTTATLVNLNSADQAALESVPGIGPVKAAAILAYRAEVGAFESIDQLLQVTGIGAATLESLRPYVTL
ncbi:MAG TPA: helix-hairpin-helix domain-containing protein [Actinomycetota bacterium]|nr:helix-hairpin-helix domain-containing protein [Actinomycetota bacterium]